MSRPTVLSEQEALASFEKAVAHLRTVIPERLRGTFEESVQWGRDQLTSETIYRDWFALNRVMQTLENDAEEYLTSKQYAAFLEAEEHPDVVWWFEGDE